MPITISQTATPTFNQSDVVRHVTRNHFSSVIHFPKGGSPKEIHAKIIELGFSLTRLQTATSLRMLSGNKKHEKHRNDLLRYKVRGKDLYTYRFNPTGVQRCAGGSINKTIHNHTPITIREVARIKRVDVNIRGV